MLVPSLIFAADGIAFTSEHIRREVANSDCAEGTASSHVIVVCGFRKSNRYRVVPPDMKFEPQGNRASVARERSRWVEGGETGIGSCGPVGPGGWTGCMQKGWRQGRQLRGWFK